MHNIIESEENLIISQAIFELRGLMREIIAKLPGLLLVFDRRGKIILANLENIRKVLGYESTEVMGNYWQNFVHPMDLDVTDHAFSNPIDPWSHRNRIRKKDGSYVVFRWALSFMSNGYVVALGHRE